MQTIYHVEDDDMIRDLVCYALGSAGFTSIGFAEPAAFWQACGKALPALVILDIMLPDEDGLCILKKLKGGAKTSRLPVILLSAKGAELDRIKGLDWGADDYVTKPFSVLELISRVKAVLRRCEERAEPLLTADKILLHAPQRKVTVSGQTVSLTFTEFELLHTLMRNSGVVLTRDQLMEQIWGLDADLESRTIDMHIKALRQKLGEAGGVIKTVRGVGYQLEAENGTF
ncbi:MAG: response regulator transcription factor [Oscillospiraceae bacterium]|jgi:two-component system alkaline phosphatase synthesis response regulator PhoP|nr:response regulator transcription factor [Oscillospiraceae bacterium]